MPSMDFDRAIIALSAHSEIFEIVLSLAEKGVLAAPTSLKDLASMAGVSSARLPQLQEAMHAGRTSAIFDESQSGDWSLGCTKADATTMRMMLHSVNLYKLHVHQAIDDVTVVISKPAHPSQLVEFLEKTLEGFSKMQTTAHALIDLAHRAKQRFTVMTPFVDDAGIARIIELFESTASDVQRELIIRRPISEALTNNGAILARMGVKVQDFRISKEEVGEHETFHAKVVRVDDDECYVGSSNMTQWSFNYSLELGFLVRGEAGRRVSRILDAVQSVSTSVHL